MKCVVCKHGDTRPGRAAVTLERGALTLVAKGVPAQVCENCAEQCLDEDVVTRLAETSEEVAQAGAQVDVREYKAA